MSSNIIGDSISIENKKIYPFKNRWYEVESVVVLRYCEVRSNL